MLLATGINPYGLFGPLFFLFMAAVVIIAVGVCNRIWRAVFDKQFVGEAGLAIRTTATVFICVGVVCIYTFAWNAMQDATTTMSHYQSPAEKAELETVRNTKMATQDELDQKRAEQIKRDEDKHRATIDSYEESMRREAEKIKQRSGPTSAPDPN